MLIISIDFHLAAATNDPKHKDGAFILQPYGWPLKFWWMKSGGKTLH